MRSGRNSLNPLRLRGQSGHIRHCLCSALLPAASLPQGCQGLLQGSRLILLFSPLLCMSGASSTSHLPSSHLQKWLAIRRVYTTLSLQGVYTVNGIAKVKG